MHFVPPFFRIIFAIKPPRGALRGGFSSFCASECPFLRLSHLERALGGVYRGGGDVLKCPFSTFSHLERALTGWLLHFVPHSGNLCHDFAPFSCSHLDLALRGGFVMVGWR